ncbi:DUF899-domain-containing protein [Penicillium hetheringtonii]|uniref:DUF899-domain-containing protein n=1 Tax=Penicillium hetheringtonii TaxID=911720 RepID=A0AAD6DQT6_9EURO|nr:DUF899-domain-containing protein [Penicillium hetheringtonii]
MLLRPTPLALHLPKSPLPPQEYLSARANLLVSEKAATHHLQSLASARRNSLPLLHIPNASHFKFDTEQGTEVSLVDLFNNRKQLILYHFMLAPGEKEGCMGCTFCMDHIPPLQHLHSRDTNFVVAATAPVDEISAYKKRMGWKFPFVSSMKTHQLWDQLEQNGEVVAWKPGNGYFGLNVFVKGGDQTGIGAGTKEGEIYLSYGTTDRGMEALLGTYALLDMTPLGRQEVGNGMGQFRRVDEYDESVGGN